MTSHDYDLTLYHLQNLSVEGLHQVVSITEDDLLKRKIKKLTKSLLLEKSLKKSQIHHDELLKYLHFIFSKHLKNHNDFLLDDLGEFIEFT